MNKLNLELEIKKKMSSFLIYYKKDVNNIQIKFSDQSGVIVNNWNFSSQCFQSEGRNTVRVTTANETRHSLFISFSL